jgi:hypothetical protein
MVGPIDVMGGNMSTVFGTKIDRNVPPKCGSTAFAMPSCRPADHQAWGHVREHVETHLMFAVPTPWSPMILIWARTCCITVSSLNLLCFAAYRPLRMIVKTISEVRLEWQE